VRRIGDLDFQNLLCSRSIKNGVDKWRIPFETEGIKRSEIQREGKFLFSGTEDEA
jgi:hypothetical protein